MGQNFSSTWENCLKRDKDKDKRDIELEPEPVTEPYPPIDPQTVVNLRVSEELLEAPESTPYRPWSDSELYLPSPPRSQVSNRQSVLLPQLSNSLNPNLLYLQNRLQVRIVPEPISQPASDSKYLFAGKRFCNSQGSSFIYLISPKTCELFKFPEDQLKEWNIVLGDFLTVKVNESGSLYDMEKAEAIGNCQVKVEGDTARILNVPVKLVHLDGEYVFQSDEFPDAVSKKNIGLGSYFVEISMLFEPIPLSDGKILFFEGTNARHRLNKKPNEVPEAQKTVLMPEPEPKPQQMIYGAGFPEFKEDSENGAGTESESKDLPGSRTVLEDLPTVDSILKGTHKEPAKNQKPGKIVGKGFENADKAVTQFPITADKTEKKQKLEQFSARALMLDIMRKKSKHPIRLLWVLDHKVEARLKKSARNLPIGHFFQGLFCPHPHFSGQLLCMQYEKALEVQIPWSLDEKGKIWLVVKLENVKDGEAEVQGIGRVVDGETENTKISPMTVKNGKLVRIQRFKIDETLSVWRVVEIL